MSKNKTLSAAKSAKNDEFYTQYADIQKEINAYLDYDPDVFRGKTVLLPCDDPEWSNFTRFFAQNFEALGLRKLISTSYAPEAKREKYGVLFEYAAEQNGGRPKNERGKIFVLDHDTNSSGRIDLDDLEWEYLEGDGDFRSEEVSKLRDEADVIVTNPPFSLFREFLAWILGTGDFSTQRRREAESAESGLAAKNAKIAKKFLIIGNMNAITYKEVFPLIMKNKVCRIVRSAPWDTMQTRSTSGSSARWTQTMSRRGRKAARQTSRTARCFAKRTTGRRGIGESKAT